MVTGVPSTSKAVALVPLPCFPHVVRRDHHHLHTPCCFVLIERFLRPAAFFKESFCLFLRRGAGAAFRDQLRGHGAGRFGEHKASLLAFRASTR